MCKLYLIQLRWVWRRDEVFHHGLKSHNSPRIIMLVAVRGCLGTVGSVKISMSQSIIYPTDLARHYNTFLPFSPLHQHHYYYQPILKTPGNHTFSSQWRTERRNYCNCHRFVLKEQVCLTLRGKYFLFYQVWEASILGVMIFVWIHRKDRARGGQGEETERSVKPGDIIISYLPYQVQHSTGSIIPIKTGIFNMKIPQVLFKIIQP